MFLYFSDKIFKERNIPYIALSKSLEKLHEINLAFPKKLQDYIQTVFIDKGKKGIVFTLTLHHYHQESDLYDYLTHLQTKIPNSFLVDNDSSNHVATIRCEASNYPKLTNQVCTALTMIEERDEEALVEVILGLQHPNFSHNDIAFLTVHDYLISEYLIATDDRNGFIYITQSSIQKIDVQNLIYATSAFPDIKLECLGCTHNEKECIKQELLSIYANRQIPISKEELLAKVI